MILPTVCAWTDCDAPRSICQVAASCTGRHQDNPKQRASVDSEQSSLPFVDGGGWLNAKECRMHGK